MKQYFLPFINPVSLIKAYRFHKKTGRYNKTRNDLELKLYSRILNNDMLHYGYFDDVDIAPEFIGIGHVEQAQNRYAEIIAEQIIDKDYPVLDVGCGMGGLSRFLIGKGFNIEALTPDCNQVEYIRRMNNGLRCHNKRFEDFTADKKYGTVINSESIQYLDPDITFRKVDEIILPGGRWIITDVFRTKTQTFNPSGYLLSDFLQKIAEHGWTITCEQDITMHILPMLKLLHMYVDRFLIPLSQYAEEKFTVKKAWLFYLTKNLRKSISVKSRREISAIDPELFLSEKKYMLYVLQKP